MATIFIRKKGFSVPVALELPWTRVYVNTYFIGWVSIYRKESGDLSILFKEMEGKLPRLEALRIIKYQYEKMLKQHQATREIFVRTKYVNVPEVSFL